MGPIGSMYGIFTYIWLMFMVNVGKYTIHGSYGLYRTISSRRSENFSPQTQKSTSKMQQLAQSNCNCKRDVPS